jgi:hypothetical protein
MCVMLKSADWSCPVLSCTFLVCSSPLSSPSLFLTPTPNSNSQLQDLPPKRPRPHPFRTAPPDKPPVYRLTTLVGEKLIGSCSLRLCQMTAKSYHSVARNKTYKTIPSFLLTRPPRGRHTSLPPTLPRPSSVQKMIYVGLNFVLLARETETKNWTFRVLENPSRSGPENRRKVLLYLVLIFCTGPGLVHFLG